MEPHSQTSIDDRELPPALAQNLRIALGLDDPPETLGDWVNAMARHFDGTGVALGVDELCLTESSRHEARAGDETYHFACVLDALLLPFLLDGTTEVEVRSTSPESDAIVEFVATPEGVSALPEDAVFSFGTANDVSPPGGPGEVLAAGYGLVCPYINAFPDETAYESWAASTPDAATMVLSSAAAFALARRLVEALAE